ncbi:hypothetical protein AW074_27420, partial [Escherichia coli]
MALNTWVVVSEISSFIKKKSCCLCSGLILVSPFSLGADIECLYSSCYADDNIIITTERNLIDEAKQQYPSSRYAALFVGQKSETNLRVISGGKVTASTLQVGVNNNSVVDIRDGGEIIIDDYGQNITSLFNIGQGGEGVVNIDGAGSVLNFIPGDEEINVGYSSTGYLNITNGGKFISTPSDSSWGSIYAGGRGGASGVIKVSGKGSLLEPAYRLYVGVWGDGKLEVTSGGIVNTQNFQMGYIASGEAIVSGTGSQLNIDNTAAIVSTTNINARGTLIINNGGKVTADAIALGNTDNYDKPSTGVAEVLIGGEDNNIIQEAGIIDANKFIFRGENTSLTIKHASDNFNLVSDISSQGLSSYKKYYYGSINAVHGLTTLSGNNSGYTGALNISSPARISVTEQNNLGNATIANDGTLSITSQGNWTFSNTMTGLGFLDVNTANNTFSFQNATNTAGFRGTLMLSDTSFDLNGDNTAALVYSSLYAGSGSMVTVGAGTQNIDGLGFNGGTV